MARRRRDVPWLDQRDNGIWYACKYDAAKRRTVRESLETKDSVEAQRRFATLLTAGFRDTRSERDAGITVWRALDDYLAEHVRAEVVDKDRQATAVRRLKAFFKPGDLLSDIGIPTCHEYKHARMSGAIGGEPGRGNRKCRSESTVRRELVVLTAAANHAEKWKRIGSKASPPTPMPSIELPAETQTGQVKWFPKPVLARIFAAADGKLLAFCKIAYYTAGRRHSIETLRKAQIDLAHEHIHLDPAGAARTNKRRPTVPLYREIRPDIEALMAATTDEYLFGGIIDFYRPFAELCADLGVKGHPHMLRHSRATHMLLDGEDIYKVARLLGDSVPTVLKTYAHATVAYLKTHSTIEEVA